ncbi:hypothetical protein HO173_003995 [Letharia columbiana]|uniref:ferric-chelate reductase (NADPH) n=1 Tax=Letharia columbiana TaxID=112416 RepID=A0A8H6FZR0_9LECA|nr:uncharacterized protein HO173_003995 [Letharia columbiana]KAF6237794.1 hypothetical protein HO173_003995 [Letharia columbiana]
MDTSMSMPAMGDDSSSALNSSGVDFSNDTQAMDFLGEILDDSDLQISGNAFARHFWYGVVIVIGIAAIFNMVQMAILKLRIRAAAANATRPAKPSNIISKSLATITAILREGSYLQFTPTRRTFWLKVPPLGTISLLLAYLGFVLALEFIDNDVPGAQHYQALGIRAAWLAVAQVPLLILLAAKHNLIGLVTGVSYERLNVLHRWVSRVLLLLATLHLGYQNYGWSLYGLVHMEWSTDSCPPTGIAAYAILLWLNLSTLAPFRNLSYEFFVIQHLITFFGFIIAIMIHLPSTALYSRVYIYIPIALYIVDRLIRILRFAYNNIHPGRATLTAFEGGVTKIRVPIKHVQKWRPGAHVLLKVPRLGFIQSHPATIASVPSSHNNDLVFILKAHKGFTNRLLTSATSSTATLLPRTQQDAIAPQQTHTALIEGPYGGSHADFAAFDTVFLIAGSTGVTFILPQLLDIAHRASSQRLPVRRIEFVWVIKNSSWTSWISEELSGAVAQLRASGIDVEIRIFVTCDGAFTESSDATKKTGCQCDKSLGPCCCVRNSLPPTDDADTLNESRPDSTSSTDLDENPPAIPTITTAIPPPNPPCCSNKMKQKNNTAPTISSFASLISGRPPISDLLWKTLSRAEGETGVAVCGPLGLNATVRMAVAEMSNERGVHKGTGAQGIYLHAEGFCW